MRVLKGIAAAALVGLFSTPVFAQDAKLVERGQQVYAEQKCSMCHSIAGKGNKAGALDDVGTRLSEEEIRQWMTNPRVMAEKVKATRKPLMPAYTKLSKEDLDAVIAYMQSLKGPAK